MPGRFWKNKKVLVTGFAGFLGSNLTKRLIDLGAFVIGLDIKPRPKQSVLTKADYQKITVIRGSVANYRLVKKILQKYKIEYVFHLAAEALVENCYQNPLKAFNSNIAGTWVMLEACRQWPEIKAIVCASSDKAYGQHKKLPYTEKSPLLGDHPYDVSKSCADLLAAAYFNTFNLPVGVTRSGNIFGPGDFNFSRVIPDTIRCALTNKTFIIRSNGKFVRDYVYVDDIVNGYLMLAEQLQRKNLAGEAFNFSAENPLTVLELVKKIYAVLGKKPKYKILNQAQYEIKHQFLSSAKAQKILGWQPKYNLEKALKKTIAWYQNYLREN